MFSFSSSEKQYDLLQELISVSRPIIDGENNCCIPPTLDGWVYIEHIHGPLGGPLYTWAQYTPTIIMSFPFVLCE